MASTEARRFNGPLAQSARFVFAALKELDLHKASMAIQALPAQYPTATAIGAALFVVAAGLLVFWYEIFSGFAQPVQFVYTAF